MSSNKIIISDLLKHTKSIEQFELKNRFTEEAFNILPEPDLATIYPLDNLGESILYGVIDYLGLRKVYQLNDKYFTSIIELNMKTSSKKEINAWLDDLGPKPEKQVILMWDHWGTVITKWSTFQKYYDDFFYPVSDDLTIIDESLSWTLYLFHEEIMYFGRNDDIFIEEKKKGLSA